MLFETEMKPHFAACEKDVFDFCSEGEVIVRQIGDFLVYHKTRLDKKIVLLVVPRSAS